MSTSATDRRVAKKRLLDLFSDQCLTDNWPNINAGTKDERANAIIDSASSNDLTEFANREIGRCKQDIFILNQGVAQASDVPDMPWSDRKLLSLNASGQWPTEFYLLKQEYTVVAEDPDPGAARPYVQLKFLFPWPLQLIYSKGQVIVKLTKMHKSIRTYVPDEYGFANSKRALTETKIVNGIVDSFHNSGGSKALNLDRGLKKLWHADFCDARRIRFQSPHSRDISSMDSGVLFKNAYPDRYDEVRKQKVYKSIFEVTDTSHPLYGEKFSIEPDEGYISFGTFSEDSSDTHGVVEKIVSSC